MPPSVSSLTVSPASVAGGTPATATVALTGPAPAGGAQVALASSDPAATVPPSVTVAPGAESTSFDVTTSAVAASTLATISASYGGATQTAALTVRAVDEDKIDPDLLALMRADPLAVLPVIVEMRPLAGIGINVTLATEALDLLRLNGIAVAALSLINASAGFLNTAGIEALSLVPSVAFIHHDRTVGPRQTSAPPPPTPPEQASSVYPRVVKASKVWEDGINGRGVTVAVLDSGVAADLDLVSPTNRLLASVNFADSESESDPGGHGTHVAGIIAGNGSRSDGEFKGIAPRANIVDVRVLGRTGSGRISSVIRGIEWTLAHRAAYNIRVINLSFGARNTLSYRADPLSAAVEIAWRRGLVVVAAAGNTGPERDTVSSPGINPYVITVGATDDRDTRDRDDDLLAWFSAWGSADSNPKPDLVAPGRRLVSVRVPGSTLDTLFPERLVSARNGSTYFRLTGTSMSTGVVSGAAALVLQRRPSLTPDEVKGVLVDNTQGYGDESCQVLPDPIADGSGLVDAGDAVERAGRWWQRPRPANRGLRPSDGFARAIYPVLYGTPLLYKDGLPVLWESVVWDSVAWDSIAWDSVAWDSIAWDSVAWDSVAWDSVAWDSVAWDSVAWDTYTLD
jgi:serine protease AprX